MDLCMKSSIVAVIARIKGVSEKKQEENQDPPKGHEQRTAL